MGEADLDEAEKAETDRVAVEQRDPALDDLPPFQFVQALAEPGGREAHPPGDVGVGAARVLLQEVEDLVVDGVHSRPLPAEPRGRFLHGHVLGHRAHVAVSSRAGAGARELVGVLRRDCIPDRFWRCTSCATWCLSVWLWSVHGRCFGRGEDCGVGRSRPGS